MIVAEGSTQLRPEKVSKIEGTPCGRVCCASCRFRAARFAPPKVN